MLQIRMALILLILHILAIVSIFVIKNISIYTIILQIVLFIFAMIGITVGYHRLWTHRSFEASPFLQWVLMLFGTSAGQKDALWWCKSHRTHHRNEDKLTDPYSITKGFFFAHIGWLLEFPDTETQKELDITDISDLEKNEILIFQKKYHTMLWFIVAIVLPILISKIWNETTTNAFFSSIIRIVLVLHSTYCVNSLAHMYGTKPYNSEIEPAENWFVSLITLGEGWHNFHHTYPKDYRASEENKYNPSALLIDFMAQLGLANNRYAVCEKTKNVKGFDKFNKDNYSNIDSMNNIDNYSNIDSMNNIDNIYNIDNKDIVKNN